MENCWKTGVYQYVYEPLPHWNIAEQQAYSSMYMSPHPATLKSQPNVNSVYNPRDVLYVDIEDWCETIIGIL